MRTRIAATLAALFTLIAGCAGCGSSASSTSGSTSDTATATPPATAPPGTPPANRPSSPATVAIVAPTDGSTEPAGKVHVQVSVTGATVVQQTSSNISPTEGHVHLYIDGNLQYMQYTLAQDFGPLKPGTYTIKAEFVASDHFPFNPRVYSKPIVFTVK
jgi:hypothetical protein